MHKPKQKVSLLVNMVAPARVALYGGLAEYFDLQIVHGGAESNRDFWHEVEKTLPGARIERAWGWQVRISMKKNGRTLGRRYIHIVPNYNCQRVYDANLKRRTRRGVGSTPHE